MMGINKIDSLCAVFLTAFICAAGCSNDKGILDELSSNRFRVVLKGTYSSSAQVEDWILPANSEDSLIKDNSISLCTDETATGTVVELPSKYMLDLAEMKVNKDKFANYRRAMVFNILNEDLEPDTTEPFFNGTGVDLKNDDPVHLKNYSILRFNTRKMAFDRANKYSFSSSGWVYSEPSTLIFNEKQDVIGFDINKLQVNSYYDSLRTEAAYINRVYPIGVPIVGGLVFNRNYDEMVLEIRILVKNFIKKYEYKEYDSDENDYQLLATHFYGFSDWLREVGPGEDDIGGNIIAVARSYNPALVGSITGTTPATPSGHMFVIAIPSEDSITRYALIDPGPDPDNPRPYTGSGTITETGDSIYQITRSDDPTDYDQGGKFISEGDYIEIDPWETGSTRTRKKYFITEISDDTISFRAKSGYGGSAGSVSYAFYPASSRNNNPCSLPNEPDDNHVDFDSYLEYLASYEQYRYDWNSSIGDCNNMELIDKEDNGSVDWTALTNYENTWTNYETSVQDIILPPLATYAASSATYTIDNVKAGNYNVYYTNVDVSAPSRYAKLFYTHEFTFVDTVQVEEKQAVTLNIIP